MSRLNEYLENKKLQKKGLYDVEPGDYIEIGIEGTRHKEQRKIVKVISSDRLVDTSGNIYNRDGTMYRLKEGRISGIKSSKKSKVYARPITQDVNDKDYKKIKIDFIRKFDWEKQDIEVIEKIIKSIKDHAGVEQANKLNVSRFK